MTELVKLPSGRLVNLEHSTDFDVNISGERLYADGSEAHWVRVYFDYENSAMFHGSDARALYAYLSQQAVTIGEDGAVEAETPRVELSKEQWAALRWLAHAKYLSFNFSQIENAVEGITHADMKVLHEAGLVLGSRWVLPETWIVTDEGHLALEGWRP